MLKMKRRKFLKMAATAGTSVTASVIAGWPAMSRVRTCRSHTKGSACQRRII